MVTYGAASDAGAVYPINQDAAYVACADTCVGELCLGVVCDGVGGLAAGEEASGAVAQGFASWFHTSLPDLIGDAGATFTLDMAAVSWATLLEGLNGELYGQGMRQESPRATTCTAALVYGGGYLACQVGDSRLYKVGEQGCAQLTRDQTLVAALVEKGELTQGEAAVHPDRNMILQAVGASERIAPEFTYGPVDAGELLVMCTDGAYRHADTACLCRAFREGLPYGEHALDEACRGLLDTCLDAGETDNLTVLCLAPYGLVSRHSDTVAVG